MKMATTNRAIKTVSEELSKGINKPERTNIQKTGITQFSQARINGPSGDFELCFFMLLFLPAV